MNAKVDELMTKSVVTTRPHVAIAHVRTLMENNSIGAVPVVDSDNQPVGIISRADLDSGVKDGSPVSQVMTGKVYTVPRYDDVSAAARVMRNHKIHHLVVTHEHEVVGIISAFDLLRLVENRRFVAKNAPTPSKRKAEKRA